MDNDGLLNDQELNDFQVLQCIHFFFIIISITLHLYQKLFSTVNIIYFTFPLLPFFLQIRCFDAPLQPQALQDVKNIVERNIPSGVTANGLTMEGQLLRSIQFPCRGQRLYVLYHYMYCLQDIVMFTLSVAIGKLRECVLCMMISD